MSATQQPLPPPPPPDDVPPTGAGGDAHQTASSGFSPPPTPPAPSTPRPALRRSRTDRVIAGVCGGLGHTLGIDPVLVRLALVVLTLAGGAGVVAYLIAWIVIPEEGADAAAAHGAEGVAAGGVGAGGVGAMVVGAVLVLAGGWLLVARYVPQVSRVLGQVVWPVALILVGVTILASRRS